MPEVFIVLLLIGICFSPQIIAYRFAEHLNRNKWFWFWISFIIPIISLFILMFLPDIDPTKNSIDKKIGSEV